MPGGGKRDLSETDICDLYITPSIRQARWDLVTRSAERSP
jgi:hypothetical protein